MIRACLKGLDVAEIDYAVLRPLYHGIPLVDYETRQPVTTITCERSYLEVGRSVEYPGRTT